MTELTYLEEMDRLELDARVTGVEQDDDHTIVHLDRTVFYPQGGGQPFDTGSIEGPAGRLVVTEVRWREDGVVHIGTLIGSMEAGESVHLEVDPERREFNTRLHSAGHVVDMAIDRLGLGWKPDKGYHFPQGPYVEYEGSLDEEKSAVIERIESAVKEIVSEDHETETRFVDPEDLEELCHFVPDYIPKGKPARVVMYGDFGVACGGTHVPNLGRIGTLTIRKIKAKGDTVRVSYAID
ncbi:MAG: alanine--tRNA ligase-related protein [Thermoanaerobaculia bacterium]|nr:alanine--tRNA ligase-related protein [Thermoanaerobaculia bacterium]